jgi:hypothetical protein
MPSAHQHCPGTSKSPGAVRSMGGHAAGASTGLYLVPSERTTSRPVGSDTMDLGEFARTNAPDEGGDAFQLENSKLLDVAVDGTVMARAGSMVAHTGDLSFTGQSSAEGGLTGYVKEKMTSEGTPVMQAEGQGHLYLADRAKNVQVVHLDASEQLSVNGEDVLAFESSVDYEISTIGSISGSQAGGLTNVFLSGPGHVAITPHGDPLVVQPPVKSVPDGVHSSGRVRGRPAVRGGADAVGVPVDAGGSCF